MGFYGKFYNEIKIDEWNEIKDKPLAISIEGETQETKSRAIAYSENSFAEGANTKAGTKAFKITSLSGTTGGTGTYTLDSAAGIGIGMEYSAITSIAVYKQGKIIAINDNVVTVDNFPGDSAHPNGYPLNNAVDDPDNYNMYNLFIIVDRPDLGTVDAGFNAHAEGNGTCAAQADAHAEGKNTKALGKFAHTEGIGTMAGHASHAEGSGAKALGVAAHAEGDQTEATTSNSHAEGRYTKALGVAAHSEGESTISKARASHAEGIETKAQANGAHSEGQKTEANGINSHAEGQESKAVGVAAHAEGSVTEANSYSHAEGYGSKATGQFAHAEGGNTIAKGNYSHAEGNGTIANSPYQHVEGKYNIEDSTNKYLHILGNGSDTNNRSNAHTIDKDGNAWYAGYVSIGENNDILATRKDLFEYAISKSDYESLINRIKVLEGEIIAQSLIVEVNREADSSGVAFDLYVNSQKIQSFDDNTDDSNTFGFLDVKNIYLVIQRYNRPEDLLKINNTSYKLTSSAPFIINLSELAENNNKITIQAKYMN